MKGFDYMTNFERVIAESLEEWSDKIDAEMEKAESSVKSEDEMRERAKKIWELAHKGK